MLDLFVRFLNHKAHGSFSSSEIIDIFKHRYGEAYDVALANMLMSSMRELKKQRKSVADKKYEKMWNQELKS